MLLWLLVAQTHAMQQRAAVSSHGAVQVRAPKHSTASYTQCENSTDTCLALLPHVPGQSFKMESSARSAHLRVLGVFM